MNIHVMFFGSLVDLIGKSQLLVNDCTDVQSIKEKVICEYPQLKDCVFLISVNKKLAKDNHRLQEGNEVAFLPPFAGG